MKFSKKEKILIHYKKGVIQVKEYGFIRVGAIVNKLSLANPLKNAEEIIKQIKNAPRSPGVHLLYRFLICLFHIHFICLFANFQDIEASGEIDGRRPGRNQLRRLRCAVEGVGSKLRRLRSGDYDCARHGAEGDFALGDGFGGCRVA